MPSKIDPYFELNEKDNCVYFTGNKLEIYIPQRYIDQKHAEVRSSVQVFGCLDLVVNENIHGGIHLPAVIQFTPVDIYKEKIDEDDFVVCVLNKGGRFIENLDLIQDNMNPYFIWLEFITYGHMPKYITYPTSCNIFDDCKEIAGKAPSVDHVLYEIIMAYLARDQENHKIQYRHTNMSKPPYFNKLKDVSYAMNSTHTKIMGSYFSEGLNSSLITTETESHPIEELFRQ